jgi:predicted nucleic acid-binding protein
MIFVHLLEDVERHETAAGALFAAAEAGRCRLVASILALLEVLVLPKRQGREGLCRQYRDLFGSFPNLSVLPVGHDVVEIASDLRARHGLRTPDALHIATAIDAGAEAFVTQERRLAKVEAIRIVTLEQAAGWTAEEVHEPPTSYGTRPRTRRGAPRQSLPGRR